MGYLTPPLCPAIIKSCLAAAQLLYAVTICHLLTQGTHIHMILVVKNPDHVPSFIRHFKPESAHMLNRILSRSKRTIWCDGNDIPTVLTLRRALVAIAYLYANQVKDNLESTIENYPGFSTSKSISLPCTKSFGNRTSCCARNAPTSTKVSSCVSSRGPPPTGPGAPERRMRAALSTGPTRERTPAEAARRHVSGMLRHFNQAGAAEVGAPA